MLQCGQVSLYTVPDMGVLLLQHFLMQGNLLSSTPQSSPAIPPAISSSCSSFKSTKANEKYAGQKIDKEKSEMILQNELLSIAKEAGFDFTLGEYKEYVQENIQNREGSLAGESPEHVPVAENV